MQASLKLWFQKFTSRLRFKVLCAALSIVLVACVTGWIGLRYTNTVARSVAATTKINLPLLTNAINASNAMRSLTNLGHRLLEACEVADGSHRLLFNGTMKQDFAVIGDLENFLKTVGISRFEVKVRSARDELSHTFNNLSSICDTRTGLQDQFEEQVQRATTSIEKLNQTLSGLTIDLEKQLSLTTSTEDVTGAGRPEKVASFGQDRPAIWSLLQSLVQMRTQLTRLGHDLALSHSNSYLKSGNQKIQLYEAVMEVTFSVFDRIAPKLREAGYINENDDIALQLEHLSESILGPVGIHDIWRRASLFHSGTSIPRMALSRADIALASALSGLEQEARTLYAHATNNTRKTIAEARWVVASVNGVVAVALFAGGLLLSARITRPVENLEDYVTKLRRSDDLSQRVPEGLVAQQDEIGALAHSFNDLIADLAEARQRLLEESQAKIRTQFERLSAAIESIPQGLCLIDADDRLLMSNKQFRALYDLTPEEVLEGMPIGDVLAACRNKGAMMIDRSHEREKSGSRLALPLRQQILNFRNERTIVIKTARTPEGGMVSVHEDITERRRQEEKITHLAHHDTLTGLANRKLFRDKLSELLAELKPEERTALLYMDLDHFKLVNDSLGHPMGDRLLIAVAERLRSCLREMDKVARLGGDEFAILLTEDPRPENASRISNRIINAVSLPYEIDGHHIVIGSSIGIAMAPTDGKDPDRLMKCADMALYRAKREGRNTYWFFEPEMDAQIQAKRALELDLRAAVAGNELQLFYQPQIGVEDNKIQGFEALLRWHHQERGFVPPADFIPLAEETGLIATIGRWVLMQSCHDAIAWPDDIMVAVNISPVQFRTDTLKADVEAALSASGLRPRRLELEITEGILMQDTCATIDVLEALRRIGVHIAMDDFGTGYSSLSYIRKFNFDKIKIDRSFVHDLTTSKDSQAVVHAVCGLCSSLGIESIAEGVETEQQLEILRMEGCTQVQGYYFARPMPAQEALIKMKEGVS